VLADQLGLHPLRKGSIRLKDETRSLMRDRSDANNQEESVMANNVELLAAYFTIAGDVYPLGPTELSPFPFRDRIEAAARAGYRGVGLIHEDVMDTAGKIGLPEMKRILDDNGIKYVEMEFLLDWFADGERRRESDKIRAEMLEAAAVLGMRDIKVGPGFHEPVADIPRMRDEFAQLCREAADHGTSIVLEIMPWSNVRTIDTALGIVEGAAQPNGGILVDIWHLARGGIDYNEVSKIPAQYIGAVELDDAPKNVVGADLWEDTIHHRRLAGEGDLNPPAFIKAVQAAGYKGPYGVEILSAEFRKLPLGEMARRSFETTMRQFEKLAAAA
jgi:sugar phosphate isomerase/epimerase